MEVFLFPLVNVTLFPATTKPLNIFEPRYLKMIKDAIVHNKPIALGFVDSAFDTMTVELGKPVQFVRPVCGYGHPQIIEEKANGTCLVFLHGMGKLQLGSVVSVDEPYIICSAEVIAEDNHIETEDREILNSLHQFLLSWIEKHIVDPMQREVFIRSIVRPEEVVGSCASYLIKDPDFQQEVLQLNTLSEKIRMIQRLAGSFQLTM